MVIKCTKCTILMTSMQLFSDWSKATEQHFVNLCFFFIYLFFLWSNYFELWLNPPCANGVSRFPDIRYSMRVGVLITSVAALYSFLIACILLSTLFLIMWIHTYSADIRTKKNNSPLLPPSSSQMSPLEWGVYVFFWEREEEMSMHQLFNQQTMDGAHAPQNKLIVMWLR